LGARAHPLMVCMLGYGVNGGFSKWGNEARGLAHPELKG